VRDDDSLIRHSAMPLTVLQHVTALPLGLAQLPQLECLEFGANKQDKLKRLQGTSYL
jgi:hypothetical protein